MGCFNDCCCCLWRWSFHLIKIINVSLLILLTLAGLLLHFDGENKRWLETFKETLKFCTSQCQTQNRTQSQTEEGGEEVQKYFATDGVVIVMRADCELCGRDFLYAPQIELIFLAAASLSTILVFGSFFCGRKSNVCVYLVVGVAVLVGSLGLSISTGDFDRYFEPKVHDLVLEEYRSGFKYHEKMLVSFCGFISVGLCGLLGIFSFLRRRNQNVPPRPIEPEPSRMPRRISKRRSKSSQNPRLQVQSYPPQTYQYQPYQIPMPPTPPTPPNYFAYQPQPSYPPQPAHYEGPFRPSAPPVYI